MLTVKRSPASVCWHLYCNGIFISPFGTRKAAMAAKNRYAVKYGLAV